MSILSVVQLRRNEFNSNKDTILRKPSKEVVSFDSNFQEIVDNLIDTLKHHEIAIGFSAPQIGIPIRLSVINLNKGKSEPTLIIVNPKIISVSGKKDKKNESGMSLPHYRGEVERRYKMNITFHDRFGSHQALTTEGFISRVIAHEIDHLDGILYIDRMKDLSKLEPVDFFK